MFITNTNISETKEPVTKKDIFEHTSETFINRTMVSPEHYDIMGSLTSFVEGSSVIVDYYRLNNPYINKSTGSASVAFNSSSAEVSYDEIKNLEMKLIDELIIETDEETTTTSITGSFIVYNGISPNKEDLFIMKVADQLGVFRVTKVVDLSIHNGSNSRVSISLYSFITDELYKRMRDLVVRTFYFDKETFYNHDKALLTEASMLTKSELTKYRRKLIRTVMNRYHSDQYNTLVRPDNTFDIGIVEFFKKKVSIREITEQVEPISPSFEKDFHDTILNTLIRGEAYYIKRDKFLVCKYSHSIWDASITMMDELPLIYPVVKEDLDEVPLVTTMSSEVDTTDYFGKIDLGGKKSHRLYTTTNSFRYYPFTINNENYLSYIFSSRLYTALHNYVETGELEDTNGLEYTFKGINETHFDFDTLSYITDDELSLLEDDLHLNAFETLILQACTGGDLDNELFNKVVDTVPSSKLNEVDNFYYSIIMIHLTDLVMRRGDYVR